MTLGSWRVGLVISMLALAIASSALIKPAPAVQVLEVRKQCTSCLVSRPVSLIVVAVPFRAQV